MHVRDWGLRQGASVPASHVVAVRHRSIKLFVCVARGGGGGGAILTLFTVPFARSSSELEELDVSHSLLSDDALHKLPSNLRKLNLSYTRISGEALYGGGGSEEERNAHASRVSMVLEKPSRHLWLVLYRGMPALSASQRARVSSQVTLVV